MTARMSLIPERTRGHRPRLQLRSCKFIHTLTDCAYSFRNV